MTTRAKALLIDITRCIGCRSCELACKQAHHLPEDTEAELSSTALTVVEERQGRFVRRLCMHCQDPACVSVCPVGALQKTSRGPVLYAADRCIGCRYCMLACPFGVPRYEWDQVAPPNAPAKIAIRVMPICTVERNRLGSLAKSRAA